MTAKEMNWLIRASLFLTCSLTGFVYGRNLGVFWQVTDFHYDSNYSLSGNPLDMCHFDRRSNSQSSLGSYGNYQCDAPWKLVDATVIAMRKLEPNPDFILWTGDNIPHINEDEYNLLKNYITIGNITQLLLQAFPNTSFFPVLGNHDPYPADQMPFSPWVAGGKAYMYYKSILERSNWREMLGKEEQEVFPIGGFYSTVYKSGLKLICLNTNLYYKPNLLVKNVPDPGFQFAWLENQLALAKGKGEKVYIAAHIAPGAFELKAGAYFFYENYNKHYLEIIRRYSDIIMGQFYGHEHTDSFRVLYEDQGLPVGQMFLAPAVTPWKKTNNPSVRLYQYDRDTNEVIDIFQYFLNLTEANAVDKAEWRLEYQMTKAFQIPDLSPLSLASLVESFRDQSANFQRYLIYNKVSSDLSTDCNTTCYLSQMCAITELDLKGYDRCLGRIEPPTHHPTHATTPRSSSTTDHHHHGKRPIPKYMFYVIGGLTAVVLLLFIIVALLCIGRRHHMSPLRFSRLPSYAPAPIN